MDAILAALEALGAQNKPQAAPAPAPPAPAPKKPAPKAVQPQAQEPHPTQQHAPAGAFQGLFEDGNTLMRAIVASEVLGPPAALRENHFWNRQPNEPLT